MDCLETKPTCKYCSGEHRSSSCADEIKKDKSKHKCANCAKARNEEFVRNASTHNSSSINCPIIVAVTKWTFKNTEMVSKN